MKKIGIRLIRRRAVWFLVVVAVITVLVAAVWPQERATSAPGWTAAVNISNSAYGAFSPKSVIDAQGYTHVVWFGNGSTNSQWSIWYTNNRASGTWATPKKITSGQDLRAPAIAIDTNGGLHVVYEDRGVNEIMYVGSTDYGATWSYKYNVSSSPDKAYEPGICVDADNNVHAVWIDNRWASGPQYQVTYSKRTAGSWSTPIRAQNNVGFNKAPRVTTTGSGVDLAVHIAFYGKSADTDPNYMYELYYLRNIGGAWEGTRNLSNSPYDASYDPEITRQAGTTNLYITWDETPPGGYHDIYMIRSTDNGVTWSSSYHVTTDAALSRFPSIVFAQNKAHMVYDSDATGNGEAFYSYYDVPSNSIAMPIDLSSNSSESKEADILADECRLGVSWMDKGASVWDVLYTTNPTSPPGPCIPPTPSLTPPPSASPEPTATATPTPSPTPSPTPDPRPHGWVDVVAMQPSGSRDYSQILTTTLEFSVSSDIGRPIDGMLMRFDNWQDFQDNPAWVAFQPVTYNWGLLQTPYNCEYKWVFAQFQDDVGQQSPIYSDYIFYDNYLTASMSLNGGNPYTSRTMVTVNSEDRDLAAECSGLRDMLLQEQGVITYTHWISYFPEIYFFLAPDGPATRTVVAEYRDFAGNTGLFSDSIVYDTTPPTGTPPLLNYGVATTTGLLIPVSELHGYDQSGIANVWLANRVNGPWLSMPYVDPPYDYTWNLAYGGPPSKIQPVYVMYEDGAGYGSVPGNFSKVYSSTIAVSGITNAYLPLIPRGSGGQPAPIPAPSEVGLILLSNRPQAGPGQEVLLYLAARREQATPLEGTLRMALPEGLRVVRAWSAYGQLLQVGDREVTSYEWASNQLVPWILVQARVEVGAGSVLRVQGDMTWSGGTTTAAPAQIENR